MATQITALKLTTTERKALDQLVSAGHYATLSRALRAGLMLLLEKHKVKLEALVEIRCERVHHPMRRRRRPGIDD